MALVRVTAPASPVLTLAEAADHLRVKLAGSPPAYPEAALITAYVQAAIDDVDGADGWLNRALVTQTWRSSGDRFPRGSGSAAAIVLPLTSALPQASPPATVVSEITYVDSAGAAQSVSAASYRVLVEREPNIVEPLHGTTWPAVRRQRDAVAITYTAGYGAPADVPELIKSYLRLRVAELFELREASVVGQSIAPNPFVQRALQNYRLRVSER